MTLRWALEHTRSGAERTAGHVPVYDSGGGALMAVWVDEVVSEERLLHPGHAACAGCGPAINVRHVLGGLAAARPESKIVLVIPASCWTIIAGIWPVNAFGVHGLSDPVRVRGRGGVRDQGRAAAARRRATRTVVVWGGDGSTCDIGFSGVSAAAERNEDIVYALNDNEAYMNTGVQKSGATPEGAWTTTTPTTAPRAGQKKDIARIMAAHGVPYVATLAAGSVPMLKDFRAKVARAADVSRLPLPARPRRLPARLEATRPRSPRRSRGWRSSRTTSRSGNATTARGASRSGRSTRRRSASSSAPRDASATSPPRRSRPSSPTSTSAGTS